MTRVTCAIAVVSLLLGWRSAAAEPPTIDNVRVVSVAAADGGREAGIGDEIVLKVEDLRDLVDLAKCVGRDGQPLPGCREQQIALYLDGREIKGLVPESGAPLPDQQTLQFHLQRTPESDEAWADLLGGPSIGEFFIRPTQVSVGMSGQYGLSTDVKRFGLIRVHRSWFATASIVVAVALVLLVWLAISSELLRDAGPIPASGHKPYSLARFQMAFWFVLVVVSFSFIWLVTNAMDTITGSTLALIGIGAGTFLGATAIDSGTTAGQKQKVKDLTTQRDALQADIAALQAQLATVPPPPNAADLQQQVNVKQAMRTQVAADLAAASASLEAKSSGGFLNDILTDPNDGISFHRFQMFVWTLVLGVLFVYSVWKRLSMPDFASTQLGLLGISAGTYLGFKIPEQKS